MYRVLFMLFVLALSGCVDPLNLDGGEEGSHLVVEGSFTNEPELNYVRLTHSQPYAAPFYRPEEGARVYVSGEEGERYEFVYGGEGYYYPAEAGARGAVGGSYTLHVEVGERSYASEPAVLPEPVAIDSVYFRLDEQTYSFSGSKEKRLLPGYRILVDYRDPAGERNFYRWSFSSLYKVTTQPLDYSAPPKQCCSQCWVRENFRQFTAESDRLTQGQLVVNRTVRFMPFERYLQERHKLRVFQHSTSEQAYNFFRLLEQQKGSTGTVFDAPPAEVRGNVRRVGAGGEQVLGFFEVSSVSAWDVTVDRTDIDYPVGTLYFPDDCQVIPGATTTRPKDW